MSGVTFQGPLDLTAARASLSVANGLTATGAGGVGAGTINANGGASALTFLGTQSIDNVTINAGNPAGGDTSMNFGDLTLGANATINQLGGGTTSSWSIDTGTSLTNNGTIQASQLNAGADIVTTTLINNGLISGGNPYGGFSPQGYDVTNNGTIMVGGASAFPPPTVSPTMA